MGFFYINIKNICNIVLENVIVIRFFLNVFCMFIVWSVVFVIGKRVRIIFFFSKWVRFIKKSFM